MGNHDGKLIEDNLNEQQQFMLEMNSITMERQIQMQDQMRRRMVAMEMAKSREIFLWLGSFYAVGGTGMLLAFAKTKKPWTVAPLLPWTFLVGYQGDLAYGSKTERIKAEAENILKYEKDLIEMPLGVPTLSSIDAGRISVQEQKKYQAITRQ